MSNKNNLRFLVVVLAAAFAIAALVFSDTAVLAQNTNSSTTGDDSMQNSNMTMGTRRGRRGRRGRRRPAAAADAATGKDTAVIVPQDTPGEMNMSGEQADLSGTYTGQVMMSGGHDMMGDATLTITSGQFTLASGGMSHAGRITAVTTRGYIGASFFFSDLTDSTTNTPVVATVRARKSGDHLTLSPVPGTRTKLSFNSGGGMGGGRRGRRGRRPTMSIIAPVNAPAETTSPADTSMSGADTGTTTAAPRSRRGRRGRRGRATTNTNMNANTGDNSNSATPPR